MISVIIPTYNRCSDLRRTLEGFEAQQIDGVPLEVVVVDDGSTDDTAEFLSTYAPQRFRLIRERQQNQGPAAARNRALTRATGELVLFTGDDICPAPDLLASHLAAHEEYDDPGIAILGRIEWPDDLALTTTMRHITGPGAEQFSFHYMTDGDEYDFRHLYTSNVSLRRSLLDREPNYFSTEFPAAAFEDAEFAYRLVPHGLRIVYRQDPVGFHYHHYTARGFFARQVRCGRMAHRLVTLCPGSRPLLGLEEVVRRQRRVRLALHWRRRRFDRMVRELDGKLDEALRQAERLDPIPPEEQSFAPEEFLTPLFRYGYLRGVTEAFCSAAVVEPLSAELFRRIVEPVVPAN